MHDEAFAWVERAVAEYGPFERVLEYGGRNVNGTIRNLFTPASYVSVDSRDGEGVDIVADAATWVSGIKHDCVVACEIFEHTPVWPEITANAWSSLEPDGVFIATMATNPRAPHSQLDGGATLEPDEYYRNISQAELERVLDAVGFQILDIFAGGSHADLHVVARRPQ